MIISNNKVKILIVDPSPKDQSYGGSTLSLLELLTAIAIKSNSIKFIVLFLYPNSIRRKFNDMENVKTEVLFVDEYNENGFLQIYYNRVAKYFTFFKILLKKSDINLVVINSRIGSGRFAILIAKLFRMPVVVHERLWTKNTWLNRTLGNICDLIIANSNYIKNGLINGGINGSKIAVIYNGIKIPKIIFLPKLREDDLYKIIMVGNITPWKGQHIFVESYKYLQSKNIKYYLAGSIYDKEYYNSFSGKIDNKHIFYKGFITDIINEIKKYDILINASQKPEPFGRTIIEAMSVGVPVIASNTGGPLETIEHMKTGLHFQYDSPKDLAVKIDHLLSNHNLRLSIQKKAYQTVKEKFNIEMSSVKILNEYKTVLNQ